MQHFVLCVCESFRFTAHKVALNQLENYKKNHENDDSYYTKIKGLWIINCSRFFSLFLRELKFYVNCHPLMFIQFFLTWEH